MYTKKIKQLLKEKHLTQKGLSKMINLSERSLGQNLLKGDMKVSTLYDISRALEVAVNHFFTEEVNRDKVKDLIDKTELSKKKTKKNKNLKKLLKTQNLLIEMQCEKIEGLENRISDLEEKKEEQNN